MPLYWATISAKMATKFPLIFSIKSVIILGSKRSQFDNEICQSCKQIYPCRIDRYFAKYQCRFLAPYCAAKLHHQTKVSLLIGIQRQRRNSPKLKKAIWLHNFCFYFIITSAKTARMFTKKDARKWQKYAYFSPCYQALSSKQEKGSRRGGGKPLSLIGL